MNKRLVRKFYVRDIRDFENDSGRSVVDMFNGLDVVDLVDLVKLGNKGINAEEACNIVDSYFLDGGTIDKAFEICRECLFGGIVAEDNECEEVEVGGFYSDILDKFCMQLMSVGLGYSEFWDMTTHEIYKVIETIENKIITEMNRQISLNHTLASMIGGAVWGKLPSKPPVIEFNSGENQGDSVKSSEYGEIETDTLKSILALRKTVSK